jgi:hypothetical protein
MNGAVLIQSQVASSVATVDFVKGLDALYDEYIFLLSEVVPQTDNTILSMRFSTDGGSSFLAANYKRSRIANVDGGGVLVGGSGSTSEIQIHDGLGNAAGEVFASVLRLSRPAGSLYKIVHGTHASVNLTPNLVNGLAGGTYTGATSAINAVRFLMSSGNINGKFKLFGVRK